LSSLKEVQKVQKKIEEGIRSKRWTTIKSVYSLMSFVPQKVKEKKKILAKMQSILKKKEFGQVPLEYEAGIRELKAMAAAKPYRLKDLPRRLRGMLGGGLPVLFVVPAINPTQGDQAIAYARELRKIKETLAGGKMVIGDSNLILADMLLLLHRDGPRSVILAFLAVLLIVLLDLRRQPQALPLVLTPLLVGVGGMVVVMWLADIKLTFFNVVTFPITLGLGIDHGVYLYHRWDEDGRGAVAASLRPVAFAIALASLTSMIGFGSLFIADHEGLSSMGALACLGILTCTTATMIVLPSILVYVRRWLLRRAAKETTTAPAAANSSHR
jgi:uncharacterized protein